MNLQPYFEESAQVKMQFIEHNQESLENIIHLIEKALRDGNKIMICWNGGSAADAQHFAAEFLGKFKKERFALPAIALTTDTSILSAIGNDYEFNLVFSRQVEWLWKEGDILIGISTSGDSENIVKAVEKAKEKKMITIWLLWRDGWKLKDIMDFSLVVPSQNTPRIQECHETIYHTICEEIELLLFKD